MPLEYDEFGVPIVNTDNRSVDNAVWNVGDGIEHDRREMLAMAAEFGTQGARLFEPVGAAPAPAPSEPSIAQQSNPDYGTAVQIGLDDVLQRMAATHQRSLDRSTQATDAYLKSIQAAVPLHAQQMDRSILMAQDALEAQFGGSGSGSGSSRGSGSGSGSGDGKDKLPRLGDYKLPFRFRDDPEGDPEGDPAVGQILDQLGINPDLSNKLANSIWYAEYQSRFAQLVERGVHPDKAREDMAEWAEQYEAIDPELLKLAGSLNTTLFLYQGGQISSISEIPKTIWMDSEGNQNILANPFSEDNESEMLWDPNEEFQAFYDQIEDLSSKDVESILGIAATGRDVMDDDYKRPSDPSDPSDSLSPTGPSRSEELAIKVNEDKRLRSIDKNIPILADIEVLEKEILEDMLADPSKAIDRIQENDPKRIELKRLRDSLDDVEGRYGIPDKPSGLQRIWNAELPGVLGVGPTVGDTGPVIAGGKDILKGLLGKLDSAEPDNSSGGLTENPDAARIAWFSNNPTAPGAEEFFKNNPMGRLRAVDLPPPPKVTRTLQSDSAIPGLSEALQRLDAAKLAADAAARAKTAGAAAGAAALQPRFNASDGTQAEDDVFNRFITQVEDDAINPQTGRPFWDENASRLPGKGNADPTTAQPSLNYAAELQAEIDRLNREKFALTPGLI